MVIHTAVPKCNVSRSHICARVTRVNSSFQFYVSRATTETRTTEIFLKISDGNEFFQNIVEVHRDVSLFVQSG
jgi:hypothetical protein